MSLIVPQAHTGIRTADRRIPSKPVAPAARPRRPPQRPRPHAQRDRQHPAEQHRALPCALRRHRDYVADVRGSVTGRGCICCLRAVGG
jgi:hypothetical protein